MNEKISVIIPTYNDEATLCTTVDSVLNQSRPADEIIVVDDASGIDVEKLLGHRVKRLRILRHEVNQGAGAARNTGIHEVVGDYILFLDSDDIIYPEFLAITSRILCDNIQAAACFTNFDRRYDLDKVTVQSEIDATKLDVEEFSPETGISYYLSHTGAIIPSFTLVRKSALLDLQENYGVFHPELKHNQDFHWFVRLLLKNSSVYINDPMGIYFLRSNSLSSNKLGSWHCRSLALRMLVEAKDELQISVKILSQLRAMRSSSVRRYARLQTGEGNRSLAIKMLATDIKYSPELKTLLQMILLIFYIERRVP